MNFTASITFVSPSDAFCGGTQNDESPYSKFRRSYGFYKLCCVFQAFYLLFEQKVMLER